MIRTRLARTALAALLAATPLALGAPGARAADDADGAGALAPSRAGEPRTVAPGARDTGAGSLVFVRDHDVWIADADGGSPRAVTTDGTASQAYSSPTMSDDGVLVAVRRDDLVRLAANGQVLSRVDPPPLTDSSGQQVDGVPVDAAVSPDGSTVAYSFLHWSCPVSHSCGERSVTGFTAVDRYAPVGTPVFLNAPSWLTSTRVVANGGAGSQVNLVTPGRTPYHWFDDAWYSDDWTDHEDLGEADVSPNGSRVALVRSYDDHERIAFYGVTGDPRTSDVDAPSRYCETNQQAGYADPTWSADSSRVGWETPQGIWIAADPVPTCAVTPRLALPGGSEPDFSAASAPQAAPAVTNRALPTISGTPRVGRTLSATTGTWDGDPTSYTYRWLRNGRALRGATRSTLAITRTMAGSRLAVKVTAKRTGAASGTATSRTLTVRR